MTLPLLTIDVAQRHVEVFATERADGDMHPESSAITELRSRQQRLSGSPWWMLDEVHGTGRFDVDESIVLDPHEPFAGTGDVLVTTRRDITLAVWTADCAPLVLIGSDGTIVAAHGGWRGLAAGVIDVALDAVTEGGADVVAAVLGPVIHRCCYEFGARELALVAAGTHADERAIAATTRTGGLALDVPAAVVAALAVRGVELDVVGPCTGCQSRWFSHRVRAEPGRHATVVSVTADRPS